MLEQHYLESKKHLAQMFIASGAFMTGGQFLLKSGQMSDTYINAKKVIMDSDGLMFASMLLLNTAERTIGKYTDNKRPGFAGKAEGTNTLLGGIILYHRLHDSHRSRAF